MNADFSHTCEGCEHVVTEPWAKDIISYRCFAPGRCKGRKVRTQLGADCTPAEKVEIEYLFDFYKRLWEKEKDAFLAAYIQKHRIFAIRADVEPREMSLEESIKMSALMRGMSDESPLRAIEAGK